MLNSHLGELGRTRKLSRVSRAPWDPAPQGRWARELRTDQSGAYRGRFGGETSGGSALRGAPTRLGSLARTPPGRTFSGKRRGNAF